MTVIDLLFLLVCLVLHGAPLWLSVRAAANSTDPQQSFAVQLSLPVIGVLQGFLLSIWAVVPFTLPTPEDDFPPEVGYGVGAVGMAMLGVGYFVLYFFVRALVHATNAGLDGHVPPGRAFVRRAALAYGIPLLITFAFVFAPGLFSRYFLGRP